MIVFIILLPFSFNRKFIIVFEWAYFNQFATVKEINQMALLPELKLYPLTNLLIIKRKLRNLN